MKQVLETFLKDNGAKTRFIDYLKEAGLKNDFINTLLSRRQKDAIISYFKWDDTFVEEPFNYWYNMDIKWREFLKK